MGRKPSQSASRKCHQPSGLEDRRVAESLRSMKTNFDTFPRPRKWAGGEGGRCSVLLASRPNATESADILLVQQAFVAEAGIARFEVHPIEEKHEAGHEDDRKQCVIFSVGHKQSHTVVFLKLRGFR